MPKHKWPPRRLIAPTNLPSFDAEDPDLLVVVTETPRAAAISKLFARANLFTHQGAAGMVGFSGMAGF